MGPAPGHPLLTLTVARRRWRDGHSWWLASLILVVSGACGPPTAADGGADPPDARTDSPASDSGGDSGEDMTIRWLDVAVGAAHACSRVETAGTPGRVCWGINDVAQLGFDPALSSDRCASPGSELPCQSSATATPLPSTGAVALGSTASCIVAGGVASCVGAALFGLGDGARDPGVRTDPVRVAVDGDVLEVSLGNGHGCARVAGADGVVRVYCWGRNDYGQAGRDPASSESCATIETSDIVCEPVPFELSDLEGATDIDAGLFHSCAVLPDGGVACWGMNNAGQLGTGAWVPLQHHVPVRATAVTGAVGVAAGGYHTCAHLDDDTLVCWGQSREGQTGTSLAERVICGGGFCTLTPSAVDLSGVTEVDAFGYHTCARVDADLFCWGLNLSGQLGLGIADGPEDCHPNPMVAVPCSSAPVRVPLPGPIAHFATGYMSTCAVVADQTWCWGDNSFGQLGRGTVSVFESSPQPVELP